MYRYFLGMLILVWQAGWAIAEPFKIEQISGSLYRFVDDRHRSVFLVTPQGVVVTDPMNQKAATWLKKEIQTRFHLPVKYVIYSHNHADHIYGAEVFKEAHTVFIAHHLARQDIVSTKTKTVVPEVTFRDQMSLFLGEHEVQLRYHGPNDGRGSISMLFVKEETLFVVDWALVGRMPWKKLWSYDIVGTINSTHEVLQLDFKHFVGGHADIGTKPKLRRYFNYLQALHHAVVLGIQKGQTLEAMQKEIRLDEFKDFRQYEAWLPLNIEGVYERLIEESGMGWRSDLKTN